MRKLIIFLFHSLLLLASLPAAADTVKIDSIQDAESFLGEREVLCAVEFAVGSSTLSRASQDVLARQVPHLKQLDLETKLIRIEGFASPEGDRESNFRLSIERARAVESFLRTEHGVSLDHYITGFGPTRPEQLPAAGTRKVEIAIYDNPWNRNDIPVEMTGGE